MYCFLLCVLRLSVLPAEWGTLDKRQGVRVEQGFWHLPPAPEGQGQLLSDLLIPGGRVQEPAE